MYYSSCKTGLQAESTIRPFLLHGGYEKPDKRLSASVACLKFFQKQVFDESSANYRPCLRQVLSGFSNCATRGLVLINSLTVTGFVWLFKLSSNRNDSDQQPNCHMFCLAFQRSNNRKSPVQHCSYTRLCLAFQVDWQKN